MFLDIQNKKFGFLTAIKPSAQFSGGRRFTYWECICDCGSTKYVERGNLVSGRVKSCGCYNRSISKEKNKKNLRHGFSDRELYSRWLNMINRCYRKSDPRYHRYGGRGIKVCDEWKNSFICFEKWCLENGWNLSKDLSIDRVDNDGDYSPLNCRFASPRTQANNRSNSKIIEFNGQKMTIPEWARFIGMPVSALRGRLDYGWSIEEALNKPINLNYRKNKS